MKFTFNDDGWKQIESNVSALQNKMDDNSLKQILRKIGKILKDKVKSYAPNRSESPSYSDFPPGQYKHVVDDVKFEVKRSQSTGQIYVSVKGGKESGYKWLWLNDGHLTASGTMVPGTHFLDKAQRASEQEIDDAVNNFLEEILNGLGD